MYVILLFVLYIKESNSFINFIREKKGAFIGILFVLLMCYTPQYYYPSFYVFYIILELIFPFLTNRFFSSLLRLKWIIYITSLSICINYLKFSNQNSELSKRNLK